MDRSIPKAVESGLDGLILDRIDALRILRAVTPEEKGELLERIAGPGQPEQDIVDQLSKIRPLWRPDRFEEAHRMAMRSLEVLDRNGARPAKLPRLGPLKPVASYIVQQMTRWIVKGHQNTLVTSIRKLYERREANSLPGSPEHLMLRRARLSAARVEPGYKGKQLGLPTFLLGGAILSTVFSGLQAFFTWAFSDLTGSIILAAVLGVLFGALAWAALYAAGVARRRIRLSSDQPIHALWETIGACGNPPKDSSYDFAAYAIILLTLTWLLVPLATWLIITRL
ncbi:hypothetical protein BH10ACT2_BH10ACT2_01250 [soil metagenome]